MTGLWHCQECESLIRSVVSSDGTVVSSIRYIVYFACLCPELVVIFLQSLQISHPFIHCEWAVLLIVSARIDEDIDAAVKCEHGIVEVGPINVLFGVNGIVNILVASLEDGVLS